MADIRRINPDVGEVEGARPSGVAGVRPDNAVVSAIRGHSRSDSIPYWSDAPYVEPYNERQTCTSLRKDSQPCKAKAEPGDIYCSAHKPAG